MKRLLIFLLFALTLGITFTRASAQTNSKPTYGILVDNSGSLRMQLPQIKSLAKELVSRLHQRGPLSVYTFVRQGEVLVPASDAEWTQDSVALNGFIDRIAVTAGRTTLFDSINSVADRLEAKANAGNNVSEKVLILLTDGEDRDSQISAKTLIDYLASHGFKVYAVGLVQDLEDKPGLIRKSPKEIAVQFLNELTKQTGGRYFPRTNPNPTQS